MDTLKFNPNLVLEYQLNIRCNQPLRDSTTNCLAAIRFERGLPFSIVNQTWTQQIISIRHIAILSD